LLQLIAENFNAHIGNHKGFVVNVLVQSGSDSHCHDSV